MIAGLWSRMPSAAGAATCCCNQLCHTHTRTHTHTQRECTCCAGCSCLEITYTPCQRRIPNTPRHTQRQRHRGTEALRLRLRQKMSIGIEFKWDAVSGYLTRLDLLHLHSGPAPFCLALNVTTAWPCVCVCVRVCGECTTDLLFLHAFRRAQLILTFVDHNSPSLIGVIEFPSLQSTSSVP